MRVGYLSLAVCSLLVLAFYLYEMAALASGPAWVESPWLLDAHFAVTAVNFLLVAAYGVLVYRDEAVREHQTLWLILLLFFGQITGLVYWYRFLRRRPALDR